MSSSQDHRDLFRASDIGDKIKLFQSLLEARDLTSTEALALLNVIHMELGRAQTGERGIYRQYSQLMEALREQMPDVHQEVTEKWADLHAARKVNEEPIADTTDSFDDDLQAVRPAIFHNRERAAEILKKLPHLDPTGNDDSKAAGIRDETEESEGSEEEGGEGGEEQGEEEKEEEEKEEREEEKEKDEEEQEQEEELEEEGEEKEEEQEENEEEGEEKEKEEEEQEEELEKEEEEKESEEEEQEEGEEKEEAEEKEEQEQETEETEGTEGEVAEQGGEEEQAEIEHAASEAAEAAEEAEHEGAEEFEEEEIDLPPMTLEEEEPPGEES